MNSPESPSAVPAVSVLAGEHEITARTRSGSTERIVLRALSIRQLPRYLSLLEDEAKLIEFCAGQDPEWVDALTIESCEEILAAVHELNFLAALRWGERRAADAAKLAPLAQRVQQVSPSGLQRSPSSAT